MRRLIYIPKKRANGEGLIRKRPTGLWEGRIPIGKNPNGSTKHKTVYGRTQAAVKLKLDEIKHAVNNGAYIEPSGMTMAQWLDIYLNEYKKNSIKPTTYVNYTVRVENHIKPSIGHYKLKDLRQDIIQKLINELVSKGLAPETVKGVYNVVHGALAQAVNNELIKKNPAAKIMLPKAERKKVRVFTQEEQEKFILAAKETYMGEAFIFCLGTGVRIGELLALQWDDVHFDEDIIRICRTLNTIKYYDDAESKWHKSFGTPKTESSIRSIPLLPELVGLLNKVKQTQMKNKLIYGEAFENNRLVFATKLGRPLDPRNMQRVFKSITEKAGIEKAHIHTTRHTFATRGLERGIELRVMQELLGHANINITAGIYTHVLPDKKRESVMKLKGMVNL